MNKLQINNVSNPRILLIAVNSKFIHSSLAPWYLKAYCEDEFPNIDIFETTINDSMDSALGYIYREKPSVIGFSCYIWNIEYVLKLASTLKKALPKTSIVFGGPEVSYDSKNLMANNSFIDFIVSGEGERPFKNLLKKIINSIGEYEDIRGLTFREGGRILENSLDSPLENLNSIVSPYTDKMISNLNDRIAYFEASRGCPFSCTYCLSSIDMGVRYFSMERVAQDLQRLVDAGVKQVKFVDRTFNCNKERAIGIFKFILESGGGTNYHFEIGADLIDDSILELLEKMPEGRIQFEAGVQTTNNDVLEMIKRKTDMDKLYANVRKIREMGNIHLHLDLIAGLPGERYDSFKKSFNDVYHLKPHQLQLGFLKFLKGSAMRLDAEEYGCVYNDYTPYEIVYNRDMTVEEIMRLKRIEDLVEKYYNSQRFTNSLELILQSLQLEPFDFYEGFAHYWVAQGYSGQSFSLRQLYPILIDYISTFAKISNEFLCALKQMLRYDYLSTEKGAVLPNCLKESRKLVSNNFISDFLRNKNNIERYLPKYVGIDNRELRKHIHFELFDYDIANYLENGNKGLPVAKSCLVLFDYSKKHPVNAKYDVRGLDS